MTETREAILAAARAAAQAHGYGGLNFRDLGAEIGIRSASLHYHFPTKADLGDALAARYCEDAQAALDGIRAEVPDLAGRLQAYAAIFRRALANGNRMCLCNHLAAGDADLPEGVRAQVRRFARINTAWLAAVLAEADPEDDPGSIEDRAEAIFAAIGGAQLAARGRGDIALFDRIVSAYAASGLLTLSR